MEDKRQDARANRVEYLICAGLLLAAALAMALIRGLFSLTDARLIFGQLSDCFAVPGLLMAGVGGLSYASAKGAYDLFGYAVSRITLHELLPFRRTYERPGTLLEYKKQKDEKGRRWLPAALYSGLAAVALGVVFLVLYLNL